MRRACVLALAWWAFPLLLCGQQNFSGRLYEAFREEQQGNLEAAIAIVQPLLEAKTLSEPESGRAWQLLGLAYKEQGRLEQSQQAFEKALRIFDGGGRNSEDYTNTLVSLASLYRVMGQPQTAEAIWAKALRMYRETGNHRGAALAEANLAGAATDAKQTRAAKRWLRMSLPEAAMAADWTEDDTALLSEVKARLAESEGHPAEAAADYEHSLELWRSGHGEQNPLTGWRQVLLGEALAAEGKTEQALTHIREGLRILETTVGSQNPRYLTATLIYARVLDGGGQHAEAARLKDTAMQGLRELNRGACVGCTVGALTLRESGGVATPPASAFHLSATDPR